MEKQSISLFRRKNRWGLTVVSVALCAVLSPVLCMSVFLPQVMTILPVGVLALLGYAGPASAALCTAVLMALCQMAFGVWGMVGAAIFLLPVVIASAFAVERGRPFWYAVASVSVTMFASMGVIMALISVLAGSDVVSAITQAIHTAFAGSGALMDPVLSMMAQMGLIAAPAGAMDAAARAEMIQEFVLLWDSLLRLEMPMQMATGAVAAGLLGQALLRRGVLSRGDKVDYPPLRTWAVPAGWGRVLGLTLGALFVLAQLVPDAMRTMYYVFDGVFGQVFAIQGIAAACYYAHKRGKGRVAQGAIFALGYLLLRPAAVMLGIVDQTFDFTHRRAEMEEARANPFDPRAEQ